MKPFENDRSRQSTIAAWGKTNHVLLPPDAVRIVGPITTAFFLPGALSLQPTGVTEDV